jgi:hypothetical protein
MRKRRSKRTVDDADEVREYRRPTWHWGLPLFLIVLLWTTFCLYAFIPRFHCEWQFYPLLQTYVIGLWRQGYEPKQVLWYFLVTTILLGVWFYRARVRILVTKDALIWLTPFGEPRKLRWVDVDDVCIIAIERPFEKSDRPRRVLVLYEKRRPWRLWRRRFVLSSHQFDGFKDAERYAISIAVPAIAERLRAILRDKKGKIEFGKPSLWQDLTVLFFLACCCAAILLGWEEVKAKELNYAIVYFVLSALSLIASLRRFRRRWYAVDEENFYVIRRGLPNLRIPIANLNVASANRNGMIISGVLRGVAEKKFTIHDRRFFRRRGVMLALLRLLARESVLKMSYSSALGQQSAAGQAVSKDKSSSQILLDENTQPDKFSNQPVACENNAPATANALDAPDKNSFGEQSQMDNHTADEELSSPERN